MGVRVIALLSHLSLNVSYVLIKCNVRVGDLSSVIIKVSII